MSSRPSSPWPSSRSRGPSSRAAWWGVFAAADAGRCCPGRGICCEHQNTIDPQPCSIYDANKPSRGDRIGQEHVSMSSQNRGANILLTVTLPRHAPLVPLERIWYALPLALLPDKRQHHSQSSEPGTRPISPAASIIWAPFTDVSLARSFTGRRRSWDL